LIFVFALFQIILGVEVPQDGSDYPGVDKFIRMFIQTFRVSISGD
jgi:hypothetical protein